KVVEDYLKRVEAGEERERYDGLTGREREILTLIAQGLSNQHIAEKLYISIKTVQTHRAHVLEKLGLHDRTELVRYAMHKGLIEASPHQPTQPSGLAISPRARPSSRPRSGPR